MKTEFDIIIIGGGINGAGIAVIIGAEGEGISKSLLDACDTVCSIPIYGTVECLNVAVATGITLYHIKKLLKKSSFFFKLMIFKHPL